jgi:hypothetical protein
MANIGIKAKLVEWRSRLLDPETLEKQWNKLQEALQTVCRRQTLPSWTTFISGSKGEPKS